jgi:hypothetical protein
MEDISSGKYMKESKKFTWKWNWWEKGKKNKNAI